MTASTTLALLLAVFGASNAEPGSEPEAKPTLRIKAEQWTLKRISSGDTGQVKQAIAGKRGIEAFPGPERPPLVAERLPDGTLVIRHRSRPQLDEDAEQPR